MTELQDAILKHIESADIQLHELEIHGWTWCPVCEGEGENTLTGVLCGECAGNGIVKKDE